MPAFVIENKDSKETCLVHAKRSEFRSKPILRAIETVESSRSQQYVGDEYVSDLEFTLADGHEHLLRDVFAEIASDFDVLVCSEKQRYHACGADASVSFSGREPVQVALQFHTSSVSDAEVLDLPKVGGSCFFESKRLCADDEVLGGVNLSLNLRREVIDLGDGEFNVSAPRTTGRIDILQMKKAKEILKSNGYNFALRWQARTQLYDWNFNFPYCSVYNEGVNHIDFEIPNCEESALELSLEEKR